MKALRNGSIKDIVQAEGVKDFEIKNLSHWILN
jgi:hypothetical protein